MLDPRLRLHTIEHPQGSIETGLRGFPVAAHDARLRITTEHEKPSVAAQPIIVVIAHGAPAPVISVTILPIIVIMPAVATIIVLR